MIRNRKQTTDYHVRPVPRMRRLVVDQAWLALRKHMIHGLIEVDVTTARQAIRDHQAATGERLSFTAFLVACLGHAVGANTELQAYKDWRGRLIVFDDVDVVTIVEIVADGQSFPLAHIVRAANRRSVREIHDEIRAVQARPAVISFALGDPGDLVKQAHDAGARVMLQVTTVAQAVEAAERGVDVIIAQGGEAGGYCGSVSTMALVPQVVDAVSPIPVVAAGGIFDGRGIAAALMLGAVGVNMGTRFLASKEAPISE